jgi:bidirectional [NiFe] hydrogenase diaphorase subunit
VKPKGTTEDGKISLLTARCIGACSLAPAVIVDGGMRGKARSDELMAELEAM